ncbi:hypothetical protein TSUD_157310 [Trifolium subterraneum]|uniref:Uncharacterized protein n=1 Tax=Trifolium subterraneum TaxID=3900 RepID=A0A2Z6M1W9_TRISU|nr:hypothetical protein TSUD_157310 [Trifolium subterraneum]
MAAVTLVGPPEIYTLKSTTTAVAPTVTTADAAPTNNAFLDHMLANFNTLSTTTGRNPPMGFTENMSPTFLSTEAMEAAIAGPEYQKLVVLD